MILSIHDLPHVRSAHNDKKIVYCHGCFDVFHYGHLAYLKESKKLGDILIVSVTSNRFVNKGPGRPVFDEIYRLEILDELKCVYGGCVSDALTCEHIIAALRPDLYCKGPDAMGKEQIPSENLFRENLELERAGGALVFIENIPMFRSTNLIKYI